ncbi:serine-rich adhesin for platelets-like isoform X2 [Microplitis mediator]|uniref:serine-rich adhesin for platelets-like isoform X2 n=1 Tax=Microplitis mediator TaxID=375433 RepID=UPI002555816E|nr:serine-rich adhesin for platelets-like isoform X2 [Microplitis mediator]
MDDGDYLGAYKRFFIEFVERMNVDDQLPVKMSGHEISGEEVTGEVIDMTLQYLNQKYCPPNLQSFLVHLVIQEIKPIFRLQPEICGLKPEKNTYAPLKLMQAVTKKVNEICQRYLDNSRLALLPPPPSAPLPLTSVFAIRNSRRKMEDRHTILHDLNTTFSIEMKDDYPASYYAVFDGHAGQDAAVYCATHLHQYLAESVYYPDNLECALRDAFLKTDAHFIQKCKKHDEKDRIEKMGGLILHYGMWRVNGDLAVSRAIGDPKYKPYVTSEPEIYSGVLDGTEDFLIIACDGLWDYVNEITAAKLVYEQISRDCYNLEAVSQYLGDYSKSQGSSDNITIIVVFLTPPYQIVSRPFYTNFLLADVRSNNMETNNRFMSDANSQYDVNTELMNQQPYNKNESAFNASSFTCEKSSTVYQENGTVAYGDRNNEDLGPESNVDAVDDAGDICTLANVSRELFCDTNSDDDLAMENSTKNEFSSSKNMKQQQNLINVDNVGDSDESDDEWNFYRIEPNKDTENSLEPKVPTVVTEPGEIIKPEVIGNNKDLCDQNPIDSETAINSLTPVKTEINENIETSLLSAALNNNSEEMDFSLNPNAAEFVPVSSPSLIPSRFMDMPISGSPLKQTSMMDDIRLPSPKEFKEEASHRPHELEEEKDENISLNGNALIRENFEEFDDKHKVTLNLDDSEISSTRAEFGDESNISCLTTDFQRTSGLDGSFTDTCSASESDPMVMSVGPDGFNPLRNPVDLNAIHDLNDSDLCDINSFSEEKEQTLIPSDIHPKELDLMSSETNHLLDSENLSDHEDPNNKIFTSSTASTDKEDEITSQIAVMNLKNEQLSELCLEKTNDFMDITENLEDINKNQENSLLSKEQLESQQCVTLEDVEIHTLSQNQSESPIEQSFTSSCENKKFEDNQEVDSTDQYEENPFSGPETLVSHDSVDIKIITEPEDTYNHVHTLEDQDQAENLCKERDNELVIPILNVSESNTSTDAETPIVEDLKNSVDEKEIENVIASSEKSMKLSESLQEFTGLEKELSPIGSNKDTVKSNSEEHFEKPELQNIPTENVVIENLNEGVDKITTTELLPEKTKVSAVAAKNTTTVTAKSKSSKPTSKTATKTSTIKSSIKLTPTALSKPSGSVGSRSTVLHTATKKVTGTNVATNPTSTDSLKMTTSSKPLSKSGIKPISRATSVSQSKPPITQSSSTTTVEKKSTVTTNGDPKTTTISSKPLVKSSISSTRLTTTSKSKSSVGTTGSKPISKTAADTKSTGITSRPKTAPSALAAPKNRVLNSAKPPVFDKNTKETANKQISSRITSTTSLKTNSTTGNSTTTTVSTTARRSAAPATKQLSSTRTTAKNVKTSTKTNTSKIQPSNNINEIKNNKIIAADTATITNIENVPEKDSSLTPTVENQQIIPDEL